MRNSADLQAQGEAFHAREISIEKRQLCCDICRKIMVRAKVVKDLSVVQGGLHRLVAIATADGMLEALKLVQDLHDEIAAEVK